MSHGAPVANENFPFLVITELRRLGHDVTTVRETGTANLSAPDHEILEFRSVRAAGGADPEQETFIALHALRTSHAGVVVCTVDADFIGQARRIHEALIAHTDLAGQLIRINRPAR